MNWIWAIALGFVAIGVLKFGYDFIDNFKFMKEVKSDPNHWARRTHETKLQRYIPSTINKEGIIEMIPVGRISQV